MSAVVFRLQGTEKSSCKERRNRPASCDFLELIESERTDIGHECWGRVSEVVDTNAVFETLFETAVASSSAAKYFCKLQAVGSPTGHL